MGVWGPRGGGTWKQGRGRETVSSEDEVIYAEPHSKRPLQSVIGKSRG